MAKQIKLKFDANQEHQIKAIDSVVKLFDGLSLADTAFQMSGDIIPNLPEYESVLSEEVLLANLNQVQRENGLSENLNLVCDDGLVLDGAGNESWRYPVFTIDMETGTGKTYVYLRTIHELRKNYGFRKFIIIVPSIAIYEGVIKTFKITKEHFKSLYNNETVGFTEYEGSQISKVKDFAVSSFTEIMVMTIDSFNKMSNIIFKTSDKLPGSGMLPFQFIQETRPILILDESQNYRSEKSKQALRTLHPLFAINYSATPFSKEDLKDVSESHNLLYRLSPVDAFKMNLVKKIQVFGVTEEYNYTDPQLRLLEKVEQYDAGWRAKLTLNVMDKGELKPQQLALKKNDDLFKKTKNPVWNGIELDDMEFEGEHGIAIFSDGSKESVRESSGTTKTKEEVFKNQIEETIKAHFSRQEELLPYGIKVLSLFFIDRVANYTNDNGVIKVLFDKAFNRFKKSNEFFSKFEANEVRQAYFAKKKNKKGELEEVDISIEEKDKKKEDRELEKRAYEWIMKEKEKLISFDSEAGKVSFIFAHSALKEGWDNPNVFQICTLNNTVSEAKKRQEIGRGLRLAVNQIGERIKHDGINILTVIANESYESYVSNLQKEYLENGDVAPERPSNAKKEPAKRNDKIFKSKDFQEFWNKICRTTEYTINLDNSEIIRNSILKLNNTTFPEPQIVITKGKFVITRFEIKLLSVSSNTAKIGVTISDTEGNTNNSVHSYKKGNELSKIFKDERLKGFRIVEIIDEGTDSLVVFGDKGELRPNQTIIFETQRGQVLEPKRVQEPQPSFPVFNLIDRTCKELGITRLTCSKIFNGLDESKKKSIFKNPEGFAGIFISNIREVLTNHIAEKIEYQFNNQISDYKIDTIFPPKKNYAQKELIEGSKNSLYDLIQIDSNEEKLFVEQRLIDDDKKDKIICYFKFPAQFKINLPKIIGNYNPDWGIIRLDEDDKIKLQLIRETKGTMNVNLLQYPNEKRKIDCAKKHFSAIGIDYRQITHEVVNWWLKEHETKQSEML